MSKKIMGLTLVFSDDAFRWLTELPILLNFGGCAVIGLGLAIFGFFYRRHPDRFKPHRKNIRWIFGETFDSLWTFLFRSIITIFWTLDVVLIQVYWLWAVWVVFGLQATVLLSMLEWKFGWVWTRAFSTAWHRIR